MYLSAFGKRSKHPQSQLDSNRIVGPQSTQETRFTILHSLLHTSALEVAPKPSFCCPFQKLLPELPSPTYACLSHARFCFLLLFHPLLSMLGTSLLGTQQRHLEEECVFVVLVNCLGTD